MGCVRAAFLDRDGTIIEELGYLSDPSRVRLISRSGEAIARLNASGILVLVVTNQAGVARGFFPESRVHQIHRRLDLLLAEYRAHVDGYFFCPHHPTEGVGRYRIECDCRKPKPGLLRQAAFCFGFELNSAVMIGDKLSDIEAGSVVGCRTMLVRTGYGTAVEQALSLEERRSLTVVDSLVESVSACLAGF